MKHSILPNRHLELVCSELSRSDFAIRSKGKIELLLVAKIRYATRFIDSGFLEQSQALHLASDLSFGS